MLHRQYLRERRADDMGTLPLVDGMQRAVDLYGENGGEIFCLYDCLVKMVLVEQLPWLKQCIMDSIPAAA